MSEQLIDDLEPSNATRAESPQPIRDMIETNWFDKLIQPRSVAIVGASPQRGSPRNTMVRVLLKHGFAGNVYPVSPSHPEVEGLKAYPSVGVLPDVPDVALVITPAQTVPGVIAECGAKGIRTAIVFSSGFEETEGGKEHARLLAEAAREHNVAVLGANCQGVWSVRHKSMLTFSPAALGQETLKHAPIAVVSQSGALAGAIGNYLQNNGVGCSYIISVGNETCLDALDVLASLIEQDDVRVVALYIEGLEDAGRILRIAERARERDVQIVALKAGRSAVGQQATASHTGKIASSHAVYADVFEQAGVIAVNSLIEALAAVEVLAYLPHPRVSGDPKGGASVMSSSGGAGALLADHSSEYGIPMAEFSSNTATRLEEVLPEFARKANPIDLTGQINSMPNLFKDTCEAIEADPRTEAVIVQFASSGRRYLEQNGEVFKAVAAKVPLAVSFIGELPDLATRQGLRDAGVLITPDPSQAMSALSLLYERKRMHELPKSPAREPLPQRAAPRDWADTMRFCEESGITPAKWIVLGPGETAAKACAHLSYPLVVKVLPSECEHKTEMGLVRLRVRSADEVDAIAAEFRGRLDKPNMGVLVQEMLGDGVEIVLSCLRQTDFGPVISIGSGGVAVELYRDVAHLALPVSAEQVLAALRRLKLWTLLQGFRGKPAADVDALVQAAVRFGDMFLATPDVLEFEINPVIVKPAGQGLGAVDALVTTR
ncbi:MAG: Acetyl-CoA synthetase (ADP-forming) alpha and beta chains, putative [uncultured Paraburkholderia sp.]|uniref:acetate--CoA ligase family protein n=1 Tax=uncultured Paraburkholderia sp. TaxID=1822466 RepID=UPI002594A175|nr:acetate--CoA ligase family protein [uncultured Paraburkholderia sp.]CAH2894521.1 MAG: Acetyl-CoA synthetase (ADP-forming) alpha and beta chains, putative [uncultured Paraburkholderia sp.]CAH2939730.1 MAG: Acetyl-CoA synthetase (ADP-forming) alpha and beta chains, putative [uncultured Paraburkholderia sp.]